MKTYIKYLLVLAVAAVGCTAKKSDTATTKNIEKAIEAKANACKDTSKCSLDITEITDFKWDRVFVFNSPTPEDVVAQAIGMAYPDYKEGTRPLIFMYQGQIVYAENNPNGLAKDAAGQVLFSYSPGVHFFAFTPQNAKFDMRIVKSKGKVFYELFQRL